MMMMMENNTEEDTIEPRNTKRLKWDLQQSHHKNKGASGSFCSFPEDVWPPLPTTPATSALPCIAHPNPISVRPV